jgi:hypothetical protein
MLFTLQMQEIGYKREGGTGCATGFDPIETMIQCAFFAPTSATFTR